MKRLLQVVRYEGIHTDSLGHYFIGLGLLRAASRQWPDIGGCWRHGRFVLLGEELSFDAVFRYVLESWKPTPYERWWKKAQKAPAALWRERNRQPGDQVRILDAHVVGMSRNQFNPIFGTGGNVGRRELAKVWKDCRKLLSDRTSPAWLRATLAGEDIESLPDVTSAGTWFVFANKTFNSGQDWYREGRLSPWSFLLALEGSLTLRGGSGRRLGSRARPYAAFPFISAPAQPAMEGEVGLSRGEFWAPIWDWPATRTEVQALFERGLARLGGRSAQAPHEFAIAALKAGVDAGVSSFARFELRQTTSSQVFEALPREHLLVARQPEEQEPEEQADADLLMELINSGWLDRLPVEPRDSKQRGKFVGLRGPIEEAIVNIGEAPREPERWRHLLLQLSRTQTRIDRNKTLRDSCRPLPLLRQDWFGRAWRERIPEEIIVARSIASVGACTRSPLLVNLFGVDMQKSQRGFFVAPRFAGRDKVCWNQGDPLRVLADVVHRRLIDAAPDEPPPLDAVCPCPASLLHHILSESSNLDFEEVARWVPALALIDWSRAPRNGADQGDPIGLRGPDGTWLLHALFRPLLQPGGLQLDGRPLKVPIGLARRLFHLIRYGDLDEAVAVARNAYLAAGRAIIQPPPNLQANCERLTAAFLVPVSVKVRESALDRWFPPRKNTRP